MERTNRSAAPGRALRRWATAALATTLLVLTLAAVLGSWRQATIVRDVAVESARTDDYQEAAYLAATEATAVQAILREPDGEERDSIAAVEIKVTAAIAGLTARDTAQAARNAAMAQRQAALRAPVARYVSLLDAGDLPGAQALLEDQIEPTSDLLIDDLRA
jgi:hypothetical protein